MKHARMYVVSVLVLLIIAGIAGWLFGDCFEFQKPHLKLSGDYGVVGRQKVFDLTVADGWSGLRRIDIALSQGNKNVTLRSVPFTERGVKEKRIALAVDPFALKFQNGPATLTVTATDFSLFANRMTVSNTVTIDMTPPQIYPLTQVNYFNPGGTGVITYRTSKPSVTSGVWVGTSFTQGYPITISGKASMICYFALPPDARDGVTTIRIAVRDEAGNEASSFIPGKIREKKFRSDTMDISDAFLQQKMPEFQVIDPSLRGKTLEETFIAVNGTMRAENAKAIRDLCRNSTPRQLWRDTFLRMKDASPMAQFGDARTYRYGGKVIGESVHLGVDLASTSQAPIEAVNDGIVVFSGPLGIYGNTVIVDHGFGLFSLYAHLSSVTVAAGRTLKKGDVLGNSGMSGLAGGDHLHLSLIIGGQFVNPQEWWDPHWIQDNVTLKMNVPF